MMAGMRNSQGRSGRARRLVCISGSGRRPYRSIPPRNGDSGMIDFPDNLGSAARLIEEEK